MTEDVLPRWEKLRVRLGRQRAFWEYLVEGWRRDGLIPSLSALQRDLLSAFFEREDALSLTGVAALVEFYLHHRDTKDLDLFGGGTVLSASRSPA